MHAGSGSGCGAQGRVSSDPAAPRSAVSAESVVSDSIALGTRIVSEIPQSCCSLSPHRALAATSRSRPQEKRGRPSRIIGSPCRAPYSSSWSNDFCAHVPDSRNSRPRGGAFCETRHGCTGRSRVAGIPRERYGQWFYNLLCTFVTRSAKGYRRRFARSRSMPARLACENFSRQARRSAGGSRVVVACSYCRLA